MARVAIAYVEVRPDLSGFSTVLHAELAKIHAVKEVELKVDTKTLNNAISGIARRKLRPIKQKIQPEFDKTIMGRITRAMRKSSESFGGGTIGRVVSGVFKSVSSVMEQAASLGGKAMEKLGESVFNLGDKFGAAGLQISEFGTKLIANASQIGGGIGAALGLAAALAGVSVIAGGLELALAGLLAVIIPLVAAITALVSELLAVGAAIGASLLAIPGAVLVGAAAFGPLMLVVQKFQDLIAKTDDAVGPLYVTFERLKNAIFAVMSSDFIKALQGLASDTLPKLVTAISLVANAWGRLFTSIAKLAGTPAAVSAINAALTIGADLVNLMADAFAELGPNLLNFATAALPSLQLMMHDLAGIVTFVSNWLGQMVQMGAAKTLFADVAKFVHELLGLFRELAPIAGQFMTVAIGPATQFITILGRIAHALSAALATPEGAKGLSDFFASMNRIVGELGAVFIKALPFISEFGPLLADAMTTAGPLLSEMLGVFMSLFRTALPGVNKFMADMTDILKDPRVVGAVEDLGVVIGQLFDKLADTDSVMAFVEALSFAVDMTRGLIILINKLAAAMTPLIAAYQFATGNIDAAMQTMSRVVFSEGVKVEDANLGMGKSFAALQAAGVGTSDDVATAITALGNAPAWSAILNNSTAAAEALNEMGIAAYRANNEVDKQTYEKMVGKSFRRKQLQTAVKPKIDTKGIADDWNRGWNTAIDTSIGTAKTGAKKVGNAFLTNLKPTIKGFNLMDLIPAGKAYDTGREIARYLAKGITSGTKNINKATDIIYKANKANLDRFAANLKSFTTKGAKLTAALPKTWATDIKKFTKVSSLDAYLARAQKKWQDVYDAIVEFKANVKTALVPDKGLVGVFGYFPTPAEVKNRFDMQLAKIKEFTAGIVALQQKGLDPELARQWLAAGPEGAGNMVKGLANATDAEIKSITESYQAVNTEAEKVAESQAVLWKGVGEQTAKGFVEGIQSMRTLLTDTMTKAMTDAIAAAKKALKIKSPSRVFDAIGTDTMAGYIQGVDSMANATVGSVSDMYQAVASVPPSTLTPQIKPGLANTGQLGAVAAESTPEFNIRVYIGDRELTDIARVVVENADSTRARALLAGRRGG